MTSETSYYSILEIPSNASDSVVRRAYRRLALKWHPDKNPDNKEEADRRFKEISEAYEILSDPEKRRIYDVEGKSGISRHMNRSNGTSSSNRQAEGDANGDSFKKMPHFRFAFRDPADVFREFFGAWNPFDDLFRQVHLHHQHAHNLHHRTPYDKDPFTARRRHYQTTAQINIGSPASNSAPTVVNVAASAACAAAAAASLAAQQQQQRQQLRQHLQQAFVLNRTNTAPNLFHSNMVSNAFLARSLRMGTPITTGAPTVSITQMSTGLRNRSPLTPGRFSSTSTQFRGGHQIVTRTVIENGQETVTIEKDGIVMSMTVNGASVSIPNRNR